MKKFFFSLTLALGLIGAGCANPLVKDEVGTDYPTDSTPTTTATTPTSEPTKTTVKTPAAPAIAPVSFKPVVTPTVNSGSDQLPPDLLLSTVEAQGNQVVKIEFSAPAEVAKTASGFRILMSSDPNPTAANSTNWYDLGPSFRSKLWKVNATGQRYVKICVLKNGACGTAVSPVVPVEVK